MIDMPLKEIGVLREVPLREARDSQKLEDIQVKMLDALMEVSGERLWLCDERWDFDTNIVSERVEYLVTVDIADG